MRSASTAKRYAKFLYLYAKSVTGLKKWNANCKTSPLSEYFTLTDEAFLLLCHESYTAKWLSVFNNGSLPDAADAPVDASDEIVLVSNCVSMVMTCVYGLGTNQCDHNQNALYTGRTQGTKRSWTKVGMDRFNELMRLVYVNRKFNGVAFDAYMLRYIKYKRNKRSPTPAAVTPAATVVVYSDFNMQAIMEQAELQGQVDDTNNENELFHDDVDNDSMDDNDRIRPAIAATEGAAICHNMEQVQFNAYRFMFIELEFAM